jgi:GMP synthase PP-ATPase subunit
MVWGDLSPADAEALGARVYKEVAGVNRCILDLTRSGFERARPLPATVTRERLDLLRKADALVMEGLRRHELYRTVWQCPTVLLPLELDGRGREFVVIRPVLSERAMTARPALLPVPVLAELAGAILELTDISGVALDVTTKPPGTIEWE